MKQEVMAWLATRTATQDWKFANDVVGKGDKFLKTKSCKRVQCVHWNDPLKYVIKEGDALKNEHLYALILYTDFSEFCTDFSSTFRAEPWDEAFEATKKRNGRFHFVAKHLRELVQYYGVKGRKTVCSSFCPTTKPCAYHARQLGPFYTGVNCVLFMTEFKVRLSGPTSTTKTRAVAERFASDAGMIIKLNNISEDGPAREPFFDCSWISLYFEEDERLFMGGWYKLELKSIIIQSLKWNYKKFIIPFFLFDCMLSADDPTDEKRISIQPEKGQCDIVERAMANCLGRGDEDFATADAYIRDLFFAFASKKTQVTLNLYNMKEFTIQHVGPRFYSLIMHPIQEQTLANAEASEMSTNFFKPVLFELFTNLQEIVLYTTFYPTVMFAIDLIKMLDDVIDAASIRKSMQRIIIKDVDQLWLEKAFAENKDKMQAACKDNNVSVTLTKNKGYDIFETEREECWMTISFVHV